DAPALLQLTSEGKESLLSVLGARCIAGPIRVRIPSDQTQEIVIDDDPKCASLRLRLPQSFGIIVMPIPQDESKNAKNDKNPATPAPYLDELDNSRQSLRGYL